MGLAEQWEGCLMEVKRQTPRKNHECPFPVWLHWDPSSTIKRYKVDDACVIMKIDKVPFQSIHIFLSLHPKLKLTSQVFHLSSSRPISHTQQWRPLLEIADLFSGGDALTWLRSECSNPNWPICHNLQDEGALKMMTIQVMLRFRGVIPKPDLTHQVE